MLAHRARIAKRRASPGGLAANGDGNGVNNAIYRRPYQSRRYAEMKKRLAAIMRKRAFAQRHYLLYIYGERAERMLRN